MSAPDDEEKAEPATGLSRGMGLWVGCCGVIGAVLGFFLGLQLHPLAAYVGIMVGAGLGVAFAFAPSL